MKKYFGKIAMYLALFIGIFTLASCNEATFKSDWGTIDFTDGNEELITKLTFEEAKAKKNNKESFVLITACPDDVEAQSAMKTLFEVIVELGFNTKDKIYYLNSTEATKTGSALAMYKEGLGLAGVKDVVGAEFVVQAFINGHEEFDTSDKLMSANSKFDPSSTDSYTGISYYALSQYICVDLVF